MSRECVDLIETWALKQVNVVCSLSRLFAVEIDSQNIGSSKADAVWIEVGS